MTRSSPRSWALVAWLGGAVLLLLAPLLPAGGAEPRSRVEEVARLPIYWPPGVGPEGLSGNGTMIINPRARRGYEVFFMPNFTTTIQAVDLDSLKLVGTYNYNNIQAVKGSFGTDFGEFVHAVDEDENRIYLAAGQSDAFQGIQVIDGATLKPLRFMSRTDAFQPTIGGDPCTAVSCVPTPPGIRPFIKGLAFVPAISSPASRDKLLILLQDSTSAASSFQSLIFVSQWDVQTGKQDWIYRVNSCSSRELPSVGESRYQLGIFQSPNGPYIYMGCFAPGSTGQAVRLDQDGTSRPISDTGYPGPLGLIDVLVDPEADRLLLRVLNDEGESYWVFDGPSSSYTGVIGTTIGAVSAAAGLDPTTGRLYVLGPKSVNGPRTDPGGLFLADIRRSPAPQAIVFPQFTAKSTYRIKVDPEAEGRPRRLFAIPYDDFDLPKGQQAFLVLRDEVEVSIDPPLADQDRFTTDTEEVGGLTESNYTGTAHAYGMRTVLVGGIEGAFLQRSAQVQALSPCLKPDREVVLARVRRAALSNSLASASSIASDAEAITRTDLQEPGNRCYPRGLPVLQGFDALTQERVGPLVKEADKAAGQQWPFKESECAGDKETSNTAQNASGFTSTSSCRQANQETVASAVGNGFAVPNGPRVGEAFTSTRLTKVAGRGLVVRSEAWVRGIEVPGAFKIDSATTSAEAVAGGRTGTAGTTFKRAVCGVRIPRSALQSFPAAVLDQLPSRDGDVFFEGCFDPFTQIAAVGTQTNVNNNVTDRPVVFLLNRALGSRGRMRIPDPDAELAKGTPGGYLASIQKNRGEEIQARAISNDASTEVPAFELIMFNDDLTAGRGRQLYQFAGVDASSTYGIFLPQSVDLGDPGESADDALSLPQFLVEATGGFPDLEVPTTPSEVLGVQLEGPSNVIATAFNRAVTGLKFLARTPREAALAALVWLLLGLPLYLSGRRRLLLSRR